MQNRYHIYPEIHFAVSKLASGEITFEEILDIAMRFREEKDFPEVHYQLTDMRGCLFNFKSDKIKEMKSLIDKYKRNDHQKLGVYLVDQPMETAYVLLLFRSINYNREFCSTVEKAYQLLSLPISLRRFEMLINI